MHLTTGTNVLRATGEEAWLHKIVINNAAANTITVYNNGAASGDEVAILTLAATDRGTFEYDVGLNNGLTIVLGASMDVTVIYE